MISAIRTSGNIQVSLEGKGPVTLRPANHKATGGQGAIYRLNDLAIKLYLDPSAMYKAGLPDKIKRLSAIKHPYVMAPLGIVTDNKSDPVGHYLNFVDSGHHMSMVFTNDFRTKESFGDRQASELVLGMRDTVQFAHDNSAVIVDANELNWFAMINNKVEPRIIDVDSWAIDKWPATAIMPSIRDWNSPIFDDASDWFAWAIVTFQIYTGIHPYKGTLSGYDRSDLIGRMKSRASIFMPGVRLNRAVRPLSGIPGALLKWYEAVFQGTERSLPPSPYDLSVSAAPASKTMYAAATGPDNSLLVIEKLFSSVNNPVLRTFPCGLALTANGDIHNLTNGEIIYKNATAACQLAQIANGWLIYDNSTYTYIHPNLQTNVVSVNLLGQSVFIAANRLFTVTEHGLTELRLRLVDNKPFIGMGESWGILSNSTRWFDGFGILDAMGAMYLILPYEEDKVAQLRVKELDGIKIIDGKSGRRFVTMMTLAKDGSYEKLELNINRDYTAVTSMWRGPSDSPELNISILPKGVCATILRDGELDLFVPSNGTVKHINDKHITTDMILANWNDRVIFLQNGQVWSVKLK